MRLVRFSATVLFVSAALFLAAIPGYGQLLKGTILGTITDPSHGVIPAVAVNLTEVNTNFRRTEATNESGFFAFANLDPGTYRIDVEQTGFRKMARTGIVLDANTTVRVDLELAPGDVTQTVEVTADVSVLQTDPADTGGQVESQQLGILRLPTSEIIKTRWCFCREQPQGIGRTHHSSIRKSPCRFPSTGWTGRITS